MNTREFYRRSRIELLHDLVRRGLLFKPGTGVYSKSAKRALLDLRRAYLDAIGRVTR